MITRFPLVTTIGNLSFQSKWSSKDARNWLNRFLIIRQKETFYQRQIHNFFFLFYSVRPLWFTLISSLSWLNFCLSFILYQAQHNTIMTTRHFHKATWLFHCRPRTGLFLDIVNKFSCLLFFLHNFSFTQNIYSLSSALPYVLSLLRSPLNFFFFFVRIFIRFCRGLSVFALRIFSISLKTSERFTIKLYFFFAEQILTLICVESYRTARERLKSEEFFYWT